MSVPKRLATSRAYRGAPAHEREVAQRLGGRTTLASGSKHEKGDVRAEGIRVECKNTERKSFAVTRQMVDKIAKASLTAGEIPVIEIKFLQTEDHPGGSVAVVPVWALNLLQKL